LSGAQRWAKVLDASNPVPGVGAALMGGGVGLLLSPPPPPPPPQAAKTKGSRPEHKRTARLRQSAFETKTGRGSALVLMTDFMRFPDTVGDLSRLIND